MFHKIVGAVNQYIKGVYNQYGLNFDVVASTDLEDLKQYTQNFSYRAIYRNDSSVRMFEDLKQRFSNTSDYAVLLYNYEPPALNRTKFNQMDLGAYFTDNKDYGEMKKITSIDRHAADFLHAIKTVDNTDDNTYQVRDLKVIDIKLNYRLICPNQEFIDNFTTLYLINLQRNLKVVTKVDFGGRVGQHDIEIFPEFEDIDSWGLIDTTRAADLRQVGFSVNVTSPLFSNFTNTVTGVKEIVINLTL